MNNGLIFPIISAVVTLGGVFISIGLLKGKLNAAIETNADQSKKIEGCATRDELAAAIKRSDEMLDIMRQRADEDRLKAEGKFKEFYSILNRHTERITVLETNQQTVTKTLEDIRRDLNGGFNDIRKELREIWKQEK